MVIFEDCSVLFFGASTELGGAAVLKPRVEKLNMSINEMPL